jgi:chromosome segregation ATPase
VVVRGTSPASETDTALVKKAELLEKDNAALVKKAESFAKENEALTLRSKALSDELEVLKVTRTNLQVETKAKDDLIQQIQKDHGAAIAAQEKENTAVKKRADSLSEENIILRSKVDILSRELDELRAAGPTRSTVENKSEIDSLRAELVRRGDILISVQKERDDRDKTIVRLSEELRNERETTKKKLDNSYTPEDLSEYLSHVVDSFNSRSAEDSTAGIPVSYLINGMDVDLKTQVFTDGKNLKFVTADPASKSSDSMSTFKISIRAVPK